RPRTSVHHMDSPLHEEWHPRPCRSAPHRALKQRAKLVGRLESGPAPAACRTNRSCRPNPSSDRSCRGGRHPTLLGGAMSRRNPIALAIVTLLVPAIAMAQNAPQTAAQGAVITGVVRSDAQALLRGANVRIQSLNVATVANDLAQYRLVVPASQIGQEVVIEARAIGFAATQVRVIARAGSMTQNIAMVTRAVQLDQVVVTGTA